MRVRSARRTNRPLARRHQRGRHREELRHLVLPVDAVDDRHFVLAADIDRAEAAMANLAAHQFVDDRFRGPDLARAGQIAEPRSQVDRVAVAVAVDFDHLAACHADLKLHPERCGPGLQPLLVVALEFQHGPGGRRAIGKYRKDAITQRFHDAAAMRLADAPDPLNQPRDSVGGTRVPHGLEDPGAPRQVSKNNSGVGAHCVQFLVALAGGLWQSVGETPFQPVKSVE